jgi:hypothetical protein
MVLTNVVSRLSAQTKVMLFSATALLTLADNILRPG